MDEAGGSRPPANVAPWGVGLADAHWALHRAHWLARRVMVSYGPGPADLIAPPPWPEIEAVLRQEAAKVDASPYGVLQLCRVWSSIETRDPVRSKLDSGEWSLRWLPDELAEPVLAAMRYYRRVPLPKDAERLRAGYPALRAAILSRLSA